MGLFMKGLIFERAFNRNKKNPVLKRGIVVLIEIRF